MTYVVDGAQCRCAMGSSPANLDIPGSSDRQMENKQIANMMDRKIGGFGTCTTLTSMASGVSQPCPQVVPITPWLNGSTSFFVNNLPVITENSIAVCPVGGGVVTISDCGQKKSSSGATMKTANLSSDELFNLLAES
ncbi:MAG: DUF4280 domain-containing protein [Defluviitaleaceae bacterium]|nr:DUF4280 domain-containing protein [Defluviitaleaceae bacterium]